MSETLRILFVTDLYDPYIGGLTTHQRGLARELVKRGHAVRVLTMRLPGTKESEIIDGVEIQRLRVHPAVRRFTFGMTSPSAVAKALRFFDLVQGPTFVAAVPIGLATQLAGKPSILTVLEVFGQSWSELYPRKPVTSLAYRGAEHLLLRLGFTRYVAISEHTQKALLAVGIDSHRCDRIYPGIDYEFWTSDAAHPDLFRDRNHIGNRFLYMSYGRAGVSKGVEHLLDAAELVARALPDSRLLLVLNEGETYDTILKRIMASVLLRGHVMLRSKLEHSELRDAVSTTNCIVVPSVTEGFGYSVAEACALGTPVIASNTASIPEVVSGRHLLVPPRNSQAIANAILRGSDGDWLVAPPKRFTWKVATDAYEACFRKALVESGWRFN